MKQQKVAAFTQEDRMKGHEEVLRIALNHKDLLNNEANFL